MSTHKPIDWAEAQTHFERRNMKNKYINIKASVDDKIKLKNLAEKAKLTQSDFIRKAIFNKEIIVIDGLHEVTKELKRIGNNLNQLTTRANMGHFNTINFDELKIEFTEINYNLARLCDEKYSEKIDRPKIEMTDEERARWTIIGG